MSQSGLEIVVPDLESDFKKLTADATQMAEENARLRKINAQMLTALQYVLPLLQEGLPATVNFDWTKEAVAKIQAALTEAELLRNTLSVCQGGSMQVLFDHRPKTENG